MEIESCCPVCGDSTPSDTSSNLTNTGRFVKDQAFGKVFECFLRLFEVKDPPWFEKAFVFCSECSRQLTVVSELEQVMKEVERRLKESEKVVQDKLKSSESKFQSSGVYKRDQRYWKVRGEFLNKDKSVGTQEGRVPEPGTSTVASLLASPEKELEFISCEVNPSLAEDYLDESEVPDDTHLSITSVQPETRVLRSKRQRATPNPDESYKSKRSKRDEAATIKVEPVQSVLEETEEDELYQILDEMESPTEDPLCDSQQADNTIAAGSSQSQSSSFAMDPLAFAEQLEGGVVEYIKVEKNPEGLDEDDDVFNPSLPNWVVEEDPNPIKYRNVFLSKINSSYRCSKCKSYFPTLNVAKTHVEKEHVVKTRPRILLSKMPIQTPQFFTIVKPTIAAVAVPTASYSNSGPTTTPGDRRKSTQKPRLCEMTVVPAAVHNDAHRPSSEPEEFPEKHRHNNILLTRIPNSSGYHCCRCQADLPSLEEAKDHVRKEHMAIHTCVVCDESYARQSKLDAHIIEAHESKENYDKLLNDKAKEAELKWLTPGKPEISHFGVRLVKIGDGKQYRCTACEVIIPITRASHKGQLRHHVIKEHTDLCKCKECGERFGTNRALQKHITEVHKGIPKPKPVLNHPCSVCLKPFSSVDGVKRHMWSHYNKEERVAALARGEKKPPEMKRKFDCPKCVKKFFTMVALEKHMKFAHDPSKHSKEIVQCDESTFLFHSVTLSKVFGGEKYKCSACDSILETMKAAKAHVIGKHTRFYKCNQCPKRFPYKASLRIHLEKTHKQGATTYCPICEKPFVGLKPSKYHMWTHYSAEEKEEAIARGGKIPYQIDKRFQCEQCASSFCSPAAMRTHQKRAHKNGDSNEEKKICGVCGAAVVELTSHMRASHPKEEDFRFICSVCDKKFAQYARLKMHKLVTHRIGDMLKCDLCGKEYATRKNLEAHRNMHLNIRPYKCDVCPMAFTTAKVLRKHKLYKHEGVKCPPTRKRKTPKVVEVESDSD